MKETGGAMPPILNFCDVTYVKPNTRYNLDSSAMFVKDYLELAILPFSEAVANTVTKTVPLVLLIATHYPMVKRVEEILTLDEGEKIHHIELEVGGIKQAQLLEKILHIECNTSKDKAAVFIYQSLMSPYYFTICKNGSTCTLEHVRNYARLAKKRQRILHDELRQRASEVDEHKWYLSERMGYDVGLVVAAAHWLKGRGPLFYTERKDAHKKEGTTFEWLGMEKALVVTTKEREKGVVYYPIVRESDLLYEENMVQYVAGTIRSNDPTFTRRRAQEIREGLVQLHKEMHFCILK